MKSKVDVGKLRKEYTLQGLYRKDLRPDPLEEFRLWFEESVRTAGDREPNAMTLATASREGAPSARVVLLRGFDERGLIFFTNYKSRKAQHLAENPCGGGEFSLAVARAADPNRGQRSENQPRGIRRPILTKDRSEAGWVQSCQSKARWSRTGRSWRLGLRRSRRGIKTPIRLCRISGAVTGSFRNVSNSGRVEKIGYTTVFSILVKMMGVGESTGYRLSIPVLWNTSGQSERMPHTTGRCRSRICYRFAR